MNKRGLGKGLGALMGEMSAPEGIAELEIGHIKANPFQPRRNFDEEALMELAQSIKQYGLLQPIVVRKTLSGYELVAGERRWRAAQMAKMTTIPAIVKDYSDGEMTEIALIENIQRENLNPIEEAAAYHKLMIDFGLTQEEVAQKVGRSRSMIANMVRLLNLPEEIQEYVSRETLTIGQVRPLLTLTDKELQLQAAEQIIEEDLSAREVEQLVKQISRHKRVPNLGTEQNDPDVYVMEWEEKLKMLFGTKVRIKPGKNKSKIEIEFNSQEDLERLLEVLDEKQQKPQNQTKSTFVI